MNFFRILGFLLLLPFVLLAQNVEPKDAKSISNLKQISFKELTVEHGLSQNSVVSISQDSIGYMWFATQDGLNKYDGKSFTFYNKQFEDVTRPTFSNLGKVYMDRGGTLWIIGSGGTLEKFDRENETFKTLSGIPSPSCIFQNKKNDYFIGTYGEGLFTISNTTRDTTQIFNKELNGQDIFEFLEIDNTLFVAASGGVFKIGNSNISKIESEGNGAHFSALATSKEKRLWVGTFGSGLFYKFPDTEILHIVKHPNLPETLNIQDLLIDQYNNLWIATYGDGVYVYDFTNEKVKHFLVNNKNAFGISYDDVLSLYMDYTGTIWLGTDGGGLSYYDEHLFKFQVITNSQTPNNVFVDLARAITVDEDHTIWIGTSGKGLSAVNLEQEKYKTYSTENSNLRSDRIMSLMFYHHELWIGHQGEGLQIMSASGKMESFPETSKMTIWKMYRDRASNIWLCTRDRGLVLFDRSQGILKEINSENSALTSNNIRTIEEGTNNDLWIGSEDHGLFLWDASEEKIEKIHEIPDKIKSLYFENNKLWIGTNGNGLKMYNIEDKSIKVYTIDQWLANNVIYSILPDAQGNLWLSSNKGITKFNLKEANKRYIENYTTSSGLQALEFNTGAYYKGDDNLLYFGGLEGVNWFNPNQLTLNAAAPKTVITQVELFGNKQPMTPNAVFTHDQNTLTFTFAGLHFSQPELNLYRYQLVNHDTDWTFPDFSNIAHYTNLPPNNYTFRVLSSNYDGEWNKVPVEYSFRILKPWYLTNVMKVTYLLLLLLLLYGIYWYLKFRWDVKTKLQLEHAETERLIKLNEFKTTLYTNISHEFRTPLTLISGPIDHQLTKRELSEEDRKELTLVKQNANRLLNLVNQMMDLSLIDSGQLKLQVRQGDLIILLKQLVEAFKYKAAQKHISIQTHFPSEDLANAWYDKDIIEKVVSNLFSNAIKYAPENTDIILDINKKDNYLLLSLINSYQKVNITDLSRLFHRFYQDDTNAEGVGVGLALVKELITLSKGSIIANTVAKDKIQFTVTLPIVKSAFDDSDIIHNTSDKVVFSEVKRDKTTSVGKAKILIVEDDTDIRKFVVSIFKDSYDIIEASNGKIGIEKALKQIPDLIVSDVMMPVKDGISLCNELKYNELSSHIPIILLTAKVGEENEMIGLKTGADAYVTKPFNSENLKLRVEKLIENRRLLQQRFSKDFSIQPELAITSTETNFLNKLKIILDEEITQTSFNSEQFATAMLLSRTQLHRKLKAIFNMSASEFIRSQRLKLSLTLLKESDATVSEIAYQVGFNTPSYFIKCFKEVYHCTPQEFQQQ
ncbi:response regulator [Aureisphaera sp. CAU 1614]|uniref:histidine kinase n=1 Tax=Halomarinibacterium sedimenti TaxID=2857106 RepID=A0A9X1JZY0_9FLAO|nr:two-component regulator propeller domain-containing protein [Halomarinibacterium sedimenti]MBW2937816.1 response regulator [Halomarinibacterium sedimenti]